MELLKNVPWFLKGVAGPRAAKGDLPSVDVVDDMRAKSRKLDPEKEDDETAVAERETTAVDPAPATPDPMEALDPVVNQPARRPAKAKAKAKKKPPRVQVGKIEMPKRPACTGTDANVTTDICVYYKPAKYRGATPTVYLRTDSLDWLLSYAADEHHFQGVARSDPAKLSLIHISEPTRPY